MADFNFSPHESKSGTPKFNTIITKMEGMKKKSRVKSDDPERTWIIKFNGYSDSEHQSILDHYNGQYGDGLPFNWTSVPDNINNGNDLYVRYLSMEETKIFNNCWEIEITFQEEII